MDKKVRIVKKHNERKQEIIDTALKIFIRKGYEKSSVNDILNEISIAKGTFYHYFKAKEEVLDAIIADTTGTIVTKIEKVIADNSLNPEDKLLKAFSEMRVAPDMGEKFLSDIHKPENVLMHQKILTSSIKAFVPLMVEIVEEGIEQGKFISQYPKEYMEIVLCSAIVLLDDGIFERTEEEKMKLLAALISSLEKMLGLENVSFYNKIMKILLVDDL